MAANQDPVNKNADILVVDDEIANLRLLTEILTQAGYQVRSAEKPGLAIESALAYPPDLILLDVMMPEMDGFEVCRRLQAHETTREIPVIFVSALQEVDDKVRGFEVGGVDFISKPYQKLEVLARVKTHLQLREMQLHLEELVVERTAELAQANEALRKSEQRFRATFEQAAVGIAHLTREGQFLRLNQKFCDIVGYTHQEMQNLSFQDITHPDDLKSDLANVKQLLEGQVESYSMEKRYFHKNGKTVWVNLTVSLLREDTGEPRYFISVVEDITDRKLAEQQILEYQKRLKALASQLTIVEERERRHIAAELHDHVSQSLAFARLRLASARKRSSDPKLLAILDDISESLLSAIQDTKNLIFDLSSPLLNKIGLNAAITEWLELEVEKKHALKTEFIDHSSNVKMDEDIRAILFRNVRELLTNVIKHAGASQVSVRLETVDDKFSIIIEDDGVGFDPEAISRKVKREASFGLFSIQERMNDMGGTLVIESQPDHGSKAILSMPLES
jgi:two-component system sensor histidine kinase UhpB